MDDVTLTKTICSLLGEIDGWVWADADEHTYDLDEVAVAYGRLHDSPDQGVAVRVYMTDDDRRRHLNWRRVQLYHRGAPRRPDGADALAARSFARLQGLSRVHGISGAERLSMSPLGADGNGREERADNYLITLDNPEASTT
jgi:hypothetical protein